VYFSNFADQRLYRIGPGGAPELFSKTEGMRYADGAIDAGRGLLYCVREDHTAGGAEPRNAIVALDLGTAAETMIAQGHDFYSTPRLSPDGGRICWLSWDHPNMPWDETELDRAGGRKRSAASPAMVAGGPGESVFQPEWARNGDLYFVTDVTGWWNLYRFDGSEAEPASSARLSSAFRNGASTAGRTQRCQTAACWRLTWSRAVAVRDRQSAGHSRRSASI
jgi:hypothetical protein